ncbi:hypothetical protein EOM81_11195 [bacterium]|nr:hypothetical protein [bacterium]
MDMKEFKAQFELSELSTEMLLDMERCSSEHNPELNVEICKRAGLLKEYEGSDGETFEGILTRAVEILKRSI